ncbi:MAG: hypothetical protein D6797_09720 [Bdellovibrio sp.]|nr:MAG: hypothetical protein D6797_09720 [Bdellovibrio sp.]
MKRNKKKHLSFILIFTFVLSSCGTREYKERPKTPPPFSLSPQIEEQPFITNTDDIPNETHQNNEGYLWKGLNWIGVSEENLSFLESRLQDNIHSNDFKTLGSVLVGGAILGILIRINGSWFFGGPIETKSYHGFWRTLEKTKTAVGQGMVRGSLFAGSCYYLLKGVDSISFDGILGPSFKSLSSSIILGGMAALSTSTLIRSIIDADWTDNSHVIGKIIDHSKMVKTTVQRFQDWTNKTTIGQKVRYKIAPNLFLVGLGSGVGIVVYDFLQSSP